MRHRLETLALSIVIAASSSLAFAAPHGGGGGGMGVASPMMSSPQRAATSTSTTNNGIARHGQPSQNCQGAADYPADTPGHSFNAPGSAFDPNGVADSKYAGTQPQNSKNPKSVAQYDVACSNQK